MAIERKRTFDEVIKGNRLSKEEKEYRLEKLLESIERGEVDLEMIPYLERLNSFPFLMTTQSCWGHNEKPKKGRQAHIDFRSALSEGETISKILQKLDRKRRDPDIAYQIMIESYGIRYCLWLDNKKWKEQLEDLIEVLGEIEYENKDDS